MRSFIQRELAEQKQEILAAVEALKLQHQQEVNDLKAHHRAEKQQLWAEPEKLTNEVAQLKGAAESRDRASRASNLIIKGLAEETNGQSTRQAVSELFPVSHGDTPVPILEARALGPRSVGAAARHPGLSW
jgi:septal ring factor EnvC (AmiA/AmiB activator)